MIAEPQEFKKYLTNRQMEVLELLYMGYNRQEIANRLMPQVCLQAVHQIILRIRKRVKQKTSLRSFRQEQVADYGTL